MTASIGRGSRHRAWRSRRLCRGAVGARGTWALSLALLVGCASSASVGGTRYASVNGRELAEPDEAPPLEGGEHSLSLEVATVRALERSPDLAVQRLDPAIATTFEEIERAEFGATLFADGQYRREISRETNRATMEQFDVTGSRINATVGVRQRTPTGTTIETTLGYGRDESDRSPEQQSTRIGVRLTQSLLEGLRPEVNLARVHQAELEVDATRAQLRAYVIALLRDVEVAYWQAALAQKNLTIVEESRGLAQQEADAAQARVELGDLAPADDAIARSQLAIREQARIDAEAALRSAKLQLARILGYASTAELSITDALAIEPSAIDDPDAHRELAARMRPDLEEARLRLEQNRLQTVVTANGLLPRLDVFVQLAKTGFGSSFGEAIEGLGERTHEVTAGLSFEQLLGNAAAEAQHSQATLQRERAARAVGNLETLVRLDVDLALVELERARQQIAASQETAAQQARVVEAERARLEVGEGTALLLAQAENTHLQAQLAEAAALVAYRIGLVRLYAAEGSLLERRGVDLGSE